MVKDRMREKEILPVTRDFDYLRQRYFDLLEHYRNQICQRCGSTEGPFFIVDLDCNHSMADKEDGTTSLSHTQIYICKNCHKGLKQWLNIPTQDLF